jgi:general secretion pathway protein F/type IV pilus assembly protein PilC
MPLFNYKAIDSSGKKKSGLIEAVNPKEVKERLRDQGLMLTGLTLKTGTSKKENIRGEKLQTFTLLLGQLINAGVPIYESLLALEEQFRDEPFHRIILSLCDRVKGGAHLSEAMAQFPDSFNQLYTSMIDAGESAGALGPVLEKLSDLLQKQAKLKQEITTSLMYPGILASFAVLMIGVLFGFVIPSLEGIFSGRELNTFTKLVLATSHFFRDWWWVYIPLIIGSIISLFVWLKSPGGKLFLQKQLITIPFIKRLVIETALSRFCRTMNTLLKGGMTMVDALGISRYMLNNHYLEEELKKSEAKILEGSSLSREMAHSKYFPQMVARMLRVGEDAGAVDEMFGRIADIYESDLEKTLARIMSLLQPVILIVMGGIVLTVLLAVLVPLTDMSSFKI